MNEKVFSTNFRKLLKKNNIFYIRIENSLGIQSGCTDFCIFDSIEISFIELKYLNKKYIDIKPSEIVSAIRPTQMSFFRNFILKTHKNIYVFYSCIDGYFYISFQEIFNKEVSNHKDLAFLQSDFYIKLESALENFFYMRSKNGY